MGGTHAERIIALLRKEPGLDDDEIARALGIEPRQTVNQICRRLAGRGLMRREPGPGGKIVNIISNGRMEATEETSPPRAAKAASHGPKPAPVSHGCSLIPRELAKTLLVIPCSGAKRDHASDGSAGAPLVQSLPADVASELLEARESVKRRVMVDERILVPAWQRYDGGLYQAGREAIGGFIANGCHVIILSGGYGAVLAQEPIGTYETVLKPSWWPHGIIERVLIAYARRHGLTTARTITSATGPYLQILKKVRWRDAGIDDALLLTPEAESGAMRRSPVSQGEALLALRDGTLDRDWRSSYGLAINAHAA